MCVCSCVAMGAYICVCLDIVYAYIVSSWHTQQDTDIASLPCSGMFNGSIDNIYSVYQYYL